MYKLLRPLLFKMDPEKAHHLALKWVHVYASLFGKKCAQNPVQVMGLNFPNRVGLSAGLDRNGEHMDAFFKLGFGFVEVGTITPRPEAGHAKPRMFRLHEDQGLINRMGFYNAGMGHFLKFYQCKKRGILGVNLGKNVATPIEDAYFDYVSSLHAVYSIADYVTINVSSPNSKGLRQLETGDDLSHLLKHLKRAQSHLSQLHHKYVPLVIKISPDMSEQDLEATAHTLLEHQMDGVIASNTTLRRTDLRSRHRQEIGGLSGRPLTQQSTETVQRLSSYLERKIPIIGVGGIFSPEDAIEKIKAGASLVQIYTGLIYEGPRLVTSVAKALQGI